MPQRPAHLGRIDQDVQIRVVDAQARWRSIPAAGERLSDLRTQRLKQARLQIQAVAAPHLQLHHIQQTAQQLVDLLGLLQDVGAALAHDVACVLRHLCQQLGVAGDHRQGRANLMGGVAHELRLAALQLHLG
jgi:hypothetical protein